MAKKNGTGTKEPFIDARSLGHLIKHRTRELSQEEIDKIISANL